MQQVRLLKSDLLFFANMLGVKRCGRFVVNNDLAAVLTLAHVFRMSKRD